MSRTHRPWSKADYCFQLDGFAAQAKSQMLPAEWPTTTGRRPTRWLAALTPAKNDRQTSPASRCLADLLVDTPDSAVITPTAAKAAQNGFAWLRSYFSRQNPPWMKTAKPADACSGCQTSKNGLASLPFDHVCSRTRRTAGWDALRNHCTSPTDPLCLGVSSAEYSDSAGRSCADRSGF